MNKPLPATAPRISQILKEMHDLMWELSAEEKAEHMRFTEEDVMSAAKIFMFVLSNVAIHDDIDKKLPMKLAMEKIEKHGKQVRELVVSMTGFDPHKFYASSSHL